MFLEGTILTPVMIYLDPAGSPVEKKNTGKPKKTSTGNILYIFRIRLILITDVFVFTVEIQENSTCLEFVYIYNCKKNRFVYCFLNLIFLPIKKNFYVPIADLS